MFLLGSAIAANGKKSLSCVGQSGS